MAVRQSDDHTAVAEHGAAGFKTGLQGGGKTMKIIGSGHIVHRTLGRMEKAAIDKQINVFAVAEIDFDNAFEPGIDGSDHCPVPTAP